MTIRYVLENMIGSRRERGRLADRKDLLSYKPKLPFILINVLLIKVRQRFGPV